MLRKRTARILALTAGATLALSAFAGAAGAFESGRLVPQLEPPVVDVQPPTHLDINPCILTPQGCPPPTTTAPPPVKDPCRQRTAVTVSHRCPPPTTLPPPVTTPPVTTPPDTTPPATTPPEVIKTASIPVAVAASPNFTG